MSTKGNRSMLINDFNEIFFNMANYIATICPSSLIGKNIAEINTVHKKLNPANMTKFIDYFVIKVLKYKDFIDTENEEYFFKEIEKDEIKCDKELKDYGINLLEFKNYWRKLNQSDKDLIFQYLQSLCTICNEYIML